jgi:hypothetical protein
MSFPAAVAGSEGDRVAVCQWLGFGGAASAGRCRAEARRYKSHADGRRRDAGVPGKAGTQRSRKSDRDAQNAPRKPALHEKGRGLSAVLEELAGSGGGR